MKRLLVLFFWFPATMATLFFSFVCLNHARKTKQLGPLINQQKRVLGAMAEQSPYQMYSALPQTLSKIKSAIQTADARPVIIELYLEKYNSPLAPYANYIVEISDQYNLDYRLLVAIAQQESNLCKKVPADSYNCWGWGIHERGVLKFNSFEEAIEKVALGLKTKYLDQGLTTPEEIMAKYCPLSLEKGGSWAFGVEQFMGDLE